MTYPLVSCIMPTANREKYISYAIRYFLQQNYPNKELIILDDGLKPVDRFIPSVPQIKYYYTMPVGTIGTKRNVAINLTSGEIIMHWDDDDWHSYDWISKQVSFLYKSGADISGIKHVNYYSPIMNRFWKGDTQTLNKLNPSKWLNGATIAYWKSYWRKHKFKDLQKGEDDDFINHQDAEIFAHSYIDGFIAVLHADNTTIKFFENPRQKRNT
jgi:glycosyltransferase involved in cell wall biosynthesis